MNSQYVLLIIAIAALIALLVAVPCSEGFGYEAYIDPDTQIQLDTAQQQPSPSVSSNGTLATCTPPDGVWSTPNADDLGRSRLNSPCCQPPNYSLAQNYKTCSDKLDLNNAIEQCVAQCCANADAQAANYDSSWYPMAKCACSMWCYNQDVPHFKKYGTAVHYITGDIAEAQTNDSGDFIGGTGFDFSGQ